MTDTNKIASNDIILPKDSDIYQAFQAATTKRIVFFTGLSGVGKSLYIQQFSKMAAAAGRTVHLLQWDVTREAFQTDSIMSKYPEIEGVTHPMIRKAVGLWTRKGILDWHKKYAGTEHILIGELPLIGNRLVEIVQRHEDDIEPLLASEESHFFLPVPSLDVRNHIVGCRASSISQPKHERENADAPPTVVNAHWQEIRNLGIKLGLTDMGISADYHPDSYAKTYQHLLKNRQSTTLPINQILPTAGSVYELNIIASELSASHTEVEAIFKEINDKYTENDINQLITTWYEI